MQLPLIIIKGATKFVPKRGMTVRPIPGKLVPSHALTGWETGMVYDICKYDEGILSHIRGIVKGREFSVYEYDDGIEEKPV
jgi:hypothetical protein